MGVITIDLRKRQLIYEQIVENVKEQIGRGVILENDYMPSVRALANDLGINPNTIQKAYAELERQGVIQSVPGKGSLVIMGADDILGRKRESVAGRIREAALSAAEAGMECEEFCEIGRTAFAEHRQSKEDVK